MSRASSIRQGSFRGIQFLYQDAELDGGRRIARHEYAKREKGWPEDMGRQLRQFTLDVFVLGDDWMSQRDALLGALETPGKGTLVHPVYGSMSVTVPSFRARESARSLGRADFQISFLEAGDITFAATATQATGSQVMPAAASANSAMQAAAASTFAAQGYAEWLQGSACDTIGDVMGAIGDAVTSVTAAVGEVEAQVGAVVGHVEATVGAVVDTVSTAVYAVSDAVSGIVSDALTLITTPLSLMSEIGGAVSSLSALAFAGFAWADVFAGIAAASATAAGVGSSEAAGTAAALAANAPLASGLEGVLAAQQNLATTGLTPLATAVAAAPAVAAATPGRLQDAANTAAICSVVRVAALGEAAQAAAAYPWSDSASAGAARDTLDAMIDAESLLQTDAATVQALAALRLAFIREMNAIAAQLPPLLSVTLTADLPALVAAFQLYGDPSWTEDIVARNGIAHPLFVPAGQPLEILGTAQVPA